MSVQVEAGADMKRGDRFCVDPYEIKVVEELRGRMIPPSLEDVAVLAHSLFTHGQRQAVECRKIEGNRLQLVAGFTRTAAARMIREGFIFDEKMHRDPEFKIWCTITDANDKVAFLNNIVENAHRNQTSAIDDAHNQRKLRDNHGMSNADIARLYHCAGNRVGDLQKLLALNDDVQMKIHIGELSVANALVLLSVPEAERATVIAESTNGNGKVAGGELKKKVRNRILADDDEDRGGAADANGDGVDTRQKASPPRRNIARSMKEVREFFGTYAEDEKFIKKTEFAKTLLAWLDGKRTDDYLDGAFRKL